MRVVLFVSASCRTGCPLVPGSDAMRPRTGLRALMPRATAGDVLRATALRWGARGAGLYAVCLRSAASARLSGKRKIGFRTVISARLVHFRGAKLQVVVDAVSAA